MFRRSRFSVRPNVGTAGRTAATPQEAPPANQEASETPKDAGDGNGAAPVTDHKSYVTPLEKTSGDGVDQNGEGTSASAAVQRRKRFAIKPKVAPGRPSALSRTPRSPVKAVSSTPVEVSDKPATSSQSGTAAAPLGLQSPRRRKPSEDGTQPKVQPKPTLTSTSDSSEVPPAKEPTQQTRPPADKQSDSTSGGQVKNDPPRPADKAPRSLPDREATEISEKAKTLVSSKNVPSMTPSAFSLSRLLNDPSDVQRLVKAQKLRELLRQERRKEKRIRKAQSRPKEYTLDPAKMTMRDLIHYLPTSNPMTSSLEESAQENETVVPPSPGREESPERAQEPEVPPKTANPREEGEVEAEAEMEEAAEAEDGEEEQDDSPMVPQVKVAEDGSLIIDEESLTVEVQRAKGPNPAQGRDPIFERGSTTTYSSFRKGTYTKPWSSEETDMFFLAVSMVGTDFSMICQLFPHRARSEIKNKFKKEERLNSWRIDKAFRERRKLDIEYFSKLLEKILEFQKNRKKLKLLAEKNSPKKRKRKTKGKKSASNLNDVEEGDEADENQVPDVEEGREKENKELGNEGGTAASKPKRKRKQKSKSEEPNDKKNKTGETSNDQVSGEAGVPQDAEAALPEDHTNSDMPEKTQDASAAKDAAIKPAKLSRARAPKPLLPLGRKYGKKPATSTKADAAESEKEEEGASKEQENKDASPSTQADRKKSAGDDVSSEEEDAVVKPPRPTRYGRVPKPTQPLNYPAKEDASGSEGTPASPPGSTASAAKPKPKSTGKRGRSLKPQSPPKSKKPKLVTLRASQSEFSDDEEAEKPWEDEEAEQQQRLACCSGQDSSAPVFVPAGLHTPHPVVSEVDESMVELDILASMPDMLDISHDALCPDSSCEQADNEAGTAEPCEHQLDLLVDVIEFLSSEHTEVSEDESYNEAAQTLLTIGNMAHLSQSSQSQTDTHDHATEATSAGVTETSHIEEEIASTPAAQEESIAPSTSFGQEVTETSESFATVELQDTTTDGDQTVFDAIPIPQLRSDPEISNISSPQTKRGHFSKVKPKPNLGRTSRASQSKAKPETSPVRTAEESHSATPTLSKANETPAAAEGTTSKMPDFASLLFKDDISSTEVKIAEEPSNSQERFVDLVQSGPATSDQNSSEIQSLSSSESQFQPSRDQDTGDTPSESTDVSRVGTAETGFNNPLTSDSPITEVEQGSYTDSVLESSGKPSPCVPPAEDIPVEQKEEREVATSSCQSRKSRLQKVKPKPNLPQMSRTARSKPQTPNEPVGKDCSPTPNKESLKETIAEAEPQPTCTPSSVKPSQSTDPAPVLKPSLHFVSTLTPAEEQSTNEGINTSVGLVDQVDLGAATLAQSASKNQKVSEAQFEPSREQNTRDTWSISQVPDEKHVGTAESSCDNMLTTDSAVTESQVARGSNEDSAPVQEDSSLLTLFVPPVEELPASQEESEVASAAKLRSRLQKVKPKPNLPQTSKTARSKPPTTKEPLEKDSSPTPNKEPLKETIVEVEPQPTSTTSPEKQSQSTDFASVFKPSPNFSSTLTLTEERCTNEDSTPVQEDSIHPTMSVPPVDELPVSQEEGEVASTSKLRRSRLQKLKPKPNLPQTSRTARSKPPTTNEPVEKDSSPTPNKQSFKEIIAEMEPQPTSTDSPEKQSRSTDLASVFKPLSNFGSTLTPTEERCTNEETSVAAKSNQSSSENQKVSEVKFKHSREQATTEEPTCEFPDEKLTTESAVTESQVGPGSNEDSTPVQEDSIYPAMSVPPMDELPVSQEEGEVASTSKLRRSRLQKVKPKPNLPQTSRTARSKPPTTNEPIEKDSSPTPNKEPLKKIIAKVEPQPTSTTSPEKQSQSTDLASVFKPSSNFGSTITPTEERCTNEESSVAATSNQSSSENQKVSEVKFKPSRVQATTEEEPTSEFPDEKLTNASAVTESQIGPGSYEDSIPVQEDSIYPAMSVPPVDELPVSQEEGEVSLTSKLRRSRLPKVKPKPNLPQTSRTARSKPPTTNEPVEKDSSPTPNKQSFKEITAEVEPQPTSTTSPEKQSQGTDLASVFKPSSNFSSTLTPTEEQCTNEESSVVAKSNQSSSENQKVSEVKFKHSRVQATTEEPTSEFPDEKLTTESAVTESQVGPGSNEDSAPVQGDSIYPAMSVPPMDELPVSQEEGEVASTSKLRSRLQNFELKPNLPQTSRTARSKPPTTNEPVEKDSSPTPNTELVSDPVTLVQLVKEPPKSNSSPESTDNKAAEAEAQPTCSTTCQEKSSQIKSTASVSVSVPSPDLGSPHKCTEELSSIEEQKTDVGSGPVPSSEGSEQSVPLRRRRITMVKFKPNLGSSTRSTLTKLQSDVTSKPSEQCHTDSSSNVASEQPRDDNKEQTDLKLAEKDSKDLTSEPSSLTSTKFESGDSKEALDSTNNKGSSSDGTIISTSEVAERQCKVTESIPEDKSSKTFMTEMESGDKVPDKDPVEAGPSSQEDCKLDVATSVNESNESAQQINDPTADVQSSVKGSTESSLDSALTSNANLVCSDRDSFVQRPDETESELTDSSKTPSKVTQARRGRLIKPKPNLGGSSCPPQPQQVQSTTSAEAESGSLDASADHKPVSELRHDIQEQITSTSSTEGTQSYPVFSQMLPDHLPSDPDEPFFILSLTEIPVCSSGEVVNSAAEHLSYLPVTDASVRQPRFASAFSLASRGVSFYLVSDSANLFFPPLGRISGESLAAAGHDPVPVSTEERAEMGLVNVMDIGTDPSAYIASTMMNPVDPPGSTTVQPTKAVDDETEVPPTKETLADTGRPAKLQVKSSTTKRTIATQGSEQPGPSEQPKACDDIITKPHKGSGDHGDVEKEKDPDSSAGAQSTGTRSRCRKLKDLLSETMSTAPPSEPPPGRAASKLSKTKTPSAARKTSLSQPAASTSRDVAAAQPTEETPSTSVTSPTAVDIEQTSDRNPATPRTSPCTAEALRSQQSDCVESVFPEEEPTNVSQYFLSDIFTEVDEG
ncbi:transcription factor TFIIIB component B'' homolog [Embiotoca jacksoni]|uniref:transcription factor TFIIIB component B'' homolog n=1 Tax=Embiotoca jacksoni TaxID=100190 RepID=UPI003703BDB3